MTKPGDPCWSTLGSGGVQLPESRLTPRPFCRPGPERRWPAGVVAARRLPWPPLLGIAWLASAVWALMFQLPDGIGRPLTAPRRHLAGLPAMGDDPLGRLRGVTRHLQAHPTHVKGRPPMLSLWTVRWTDRGGATWVVALVIAGSASASAAIAVTIRTIADENLARRAVPFLILASTAIWVTTSMDALFLGAVAWGVALTAQATTRGRGAGPHPPWGTIPLQSSRPGDRGGKRFHRLWITPPRKHAPPGDVGLAPYGGRCVVTARFSRDVRPTPHGGADTGRRVRDAFSAHTRTVATAFAGVRALDLSGITRGEVRRSWLPYAAWMAATAADCRPPARRVPLAQAVTAPLIQALVRSPW